MITLAPGPMFVPGFCFICGNHVGEMIDTDIDMPGHGRLYICARICLPLIFVAANGLEDPDPKPLCTEIRQDGKRCSAFALPGRDLCVAHLRVTQLREKEDENVLA